MTRALPKKRKAFRAHRASRELTMIHPLRQAFLFPLAVIALFAGSMSHADESPCCLKPRCVADLKRLSVCELADLFTKAEMGHIPCGDLDGQLLCKTDHCLAKMKVWCSNLAWRGKHFGPDNYFINRWIGNRSWLDSCYTVGPAWTDGRPALILEYPPQTPLFGNQHDEIREIAPGLYLGVIFEKGPCPRVLGYFAIEIPKCQGGGMPFSP
jgi:hypothetical protein